MYYVLLKIYQNLREIKKVFWRVLNSKPHSQKVFGVPPQAPSSGRRVWIKWWLAWKCGCQRWHVTVWESWLPLISQSSLHRTLNMSYIELEVIQVIDDSKFELLSNWELFVNHTEKLDFGNQIYSLRCRRVMRPTLLSLSAEEDSRFSITIYSAKIGNEAEDWSLTGGKILPIARGLEVVLVF